MKSHIISRGITMTPQVGENGEVVRIIDSVWDSREIDPEFFSDYYNGIASKEPTWQSVPRKPYIEKNDLWSVRNCGLANTLVSSKNFMQKSNNFGERGQKAFYLDIEIKNVDTKYEVIIPAGQYA